MLDVNTRKMLNCHEEVIPCQIQRCFKLRHPRSCPVLLKGYSIHIYAKLPFKKKVSHEERGKISSYSFQRVHWLLSICTQTICFIVQNARHLPKTLTTTLLSLGWDCIIYMCLSCLSFVFGEIYSSGLNNFQTWPSNSRLYICRFNSAWVFHTHSII